MLGTSYEHLLISTGANPYQRSILMWSFQLTERHTHQGDKKVDMFHAVACPEGRQQHHTTTMAAPFLRYISGFTGTVQI